ncbi:MAG TPA: hypothetical protein VIM56_00510 [Rhizomicrobium sp.]
MAKSKVKLSYWTRSTNDFDGIEELKENLTRDFDLEINRRTSDALGGWLFEIAIEIYQKLTLHEFLQSYAEDAIKFGIGLFAKEIFQQIRALFHRNAERRPDISEIKIIFDDAEIVIYSLYEGSIQEVATDLSAQIFSRWAALQDRLESRIKSLHVPIFFHTEIVEVDKEKAPLEISAYRVRLTVDETIRGFKKEHFWKLWGIRTNSDNQIYDVENDTLKPEIFFTQEEYWDFWQKKYRNFK